MVKLPILMYHRIEEVPSHPDYLPNYVRPDEFVEHLEALRKWGYTPVALEDLLEANDVCVGTPSRPVVLTFDDGFRSTFDIAWPILQRYEARATVFLVADYLELMNPLDWSEPPAPFLNKIEILQMQTGGIRFGSHTCTHRSLTNLTQSEAYRELKESRKKLETILSRPVTTLAYPYNNNNFIVRGLARKAGYQAAVLGRGIVNGPWTSRWALRRIPIQLKMSIEEIGRRLSSWRWLAGF
jgi:peptidoglycan/xylan/chitin deacetylase (PgdA/CDA1 family)